MEGFDVVLLGSFYALPQFNQKYGHYNEAHAAYEISASWQAGLSNGAQVGEIFGLALNGWASERFGYRKTMIVALTCMIAFIFIPVSQSTSHPGTVLTALPSSSPTTFRLCWSARFSKE